MRAVELYKRYKNKQVSKDMLERLKTLLPFKWYETIRKYNEQFMGGEMIEPENINKKVALGDVVKIPTE